MSDMYDRAAELRALDATCAGVRGLVASGVTRLPRIFCVPDPEPERIEDEHPAGVQVPAVAIPVIDLGCGDRTAVVAALGRAAAEWGFFQVTGHGVPLELMAAALDATREFHEAPGGEGTDKARFYMRDPANPVRYNCNFDLHRSQVADWRDTIYVRVAPDPPALADFPDSCRRDVFFDYAKHVKNLMDTLFGLLSEALGLHTSHLADMGCNQGQMVVGHYYPPCPEPELAMGNARHSDIWFLNVLLQDGVGGLQILHDNRWVDVEPISGAFTVNISDLLQIVSNDRFRSIEHRVVAKNAAPRVSIASFPFMGWTRAYGPIKKLLSEENPPLYGEKLLEDFFKHWYSNGVRTKAAIDYFRL